MDRFKTEKILVPHGREYNKRYYCSRCSWKSNIVGEYAPDEGIWEQCRVHKCEEKDKLVVFKQKVCISGSSYYRSLITDIPLGEIKVSGRNGNFKLPVDVGSEMEREEWANKAYELEITLKEIT